MKLLMFAFMIFSVVSITDAAPPQSLITSPNDGDTFQRGMEIHFLGYGSYPATDTQSIVKSLVWSSSIDGQIGEGKDFFKTLSLGVHEIVLEVIGSDANSALTNITITVTE